VQIWIERRRISSRVKSRVDIMAGGGYIIAGCIDYFSHLALYQLCPGTYCVKVNEFKSIELNCAEDPSASRMQDQ
jgi:hypothetical protein